MKITIVISFFRHGLKSGPETWDPEIRDPDTQHPGTGTLTSRAPELGPWDFRIATLRPRILSAGP